VGVGGGGERGGYWGGGGHCTSIRPNPTITSVIAFYFIWFILYLCGKRLSVNYADWVKSSVHKVEVLLLLVVVFFFSFLYFIFFFVRKSGILGGGGRVVLLVNLLTSQIYP
jgi:tryptophan-rich sensory protein